LLLQSPIARLLNHFGALFSPRRGSFLDDPLRQRLVPRNLSNRPRRKRASTRSLNHLHVRASIHYYLLSRPIKRPCFMLDAADHSRSLNNPRVVYNQASWTKPVVEMMNTHKTEQRRRYHDS